MEFEARRNPHVINPDGVGLFAALIPEKEMAWETAAEMLKSIQLAINRRDSPAIRSDAMMMLVHAEILIWCEDPARVDSDVVDLLNKAIQIRAERVRTGTGLAV